MTLRICTRWWLERLGLCAGARRQLACMRSLPANVALAGPTYAHVGPLIRTWARQVATLTQQMAAWAH